MTAFEPWFRDVAGFPAHPWQVEVGTDPECRDRLLRIPTGFGKTAGVVLPWLFHRALNHNAAWPARLVFCLPMRVLVEQTERAIHGWIAKAGLDVPVIPLLGGRHESSWLRRPTEPTVLVGTQDMLLSRALARGYGSSRGLWPMEMAFLHSDALWVLDEIQLMDVGLATSTQLHAFRRGDTHRAMGPLRPTFSWWMSATLQSDWLKSFDFARETAAAPLPKTIIGAGHRSEGLWAVKKRLEVRPEATTPEEVADIALGAHEPDRTTLIIVNTVDRARKVEAALQKRKSPAEIKLVHSRFRGAERRSWDFLARSAKPPPPGRIIVSTQVVEAGVDISAAVLVTDLAPWPSLVQRFGRCARYPGESGTVFVTGGVPADPRKAAPYDAEQLSAAAEALVRIKDDVGPRSLETSEERWATSDVPFLAKLYPYTPLHVLRRRDFDDLFDTTPDLSGADLDVSRYIRTGEERDVTAFWRALEAPESRALVGIESPIRDELCPVPIGEAADFLKERPGFVLDYLTGSWKRVERDRLVPGMTILFDAAGGGYDARRGWDAKAAGPVAVIVREADSDRIEDSAASADDDDLSASEDRAQHPWKTIALHGREAGVEAKRLAEQAGLDPLLAALLELAGRWHDSGKAHWVFQAAIKPEVRSSAGWTDRAVAKAPREAWRRPAPYPTRPGFRHELVSTMLLFEVLRRRAPDHAALLGRHHELFELLGLTPTPPADADAHPLADELAALSAESFDLLAYVVCAHHGKVRASWSSTPRDQEKGHGGIHGVVDGDVVPAFEMPGANGTKHVLPELTLSTACAAMGLNPTFGASWGERVAGLLRRHGPFGLAYLESLFRVADWKASDLDTTEEP